MWWTSRPGRSAGWRGDPANTPSTAPGWPTGGSRTGSGLGITVAGPRRNALRAVEPDGTDATLLLRTGRDMVQLPAVSPDGLRIAIARLVHGGDDVIHICDLETGRNRRLVAGFYATWVDDDTLLVQDHPA